MKTTKYKGYTVHSNGKVEKKKGGGYIIANSINKYGHRTMSVAENNKKVSTSYHKFIWEAFNGPVPNGMTIDHIDDNPSNNRLDNLQLLTMGQNLSKAHQSLSKKDRDTAKYLRSLGWSMRKVALELGHPYENIWRYLTKGYLYND